MTDEPTASHGSRDRWTLNRAGIVNVYQYENDTLSFGGGRLLLRGVNGSGKTTAMNMLLPFLLTARLGRIDAAGEQSGILKSWMLAGREDPQPCGYIWIEFELRDPDGHTEHLTLGCGIRANRSADSVTTWWFVTDRRIGIDLALVEQGVAISSDVLRAQIGADVVFAHDRRSAYRDLVRRRLYGGADLDQFLSLLDTVRNPRVGDRIDVDLPRHLVDALPHLSEHALTEAARPLDDLDEHRANVENLQVTARVLDALSDVHRDYLRTEAARRRDTAGETLDAARAAKRLETRRRREQDDARRSEQEAGHLVEGLEAERIRLGDEIISLERSPAYEAGRGLTDLRDHVTDLSSQVDRQRSLTDRHASRLPEAVRRVQHRVARTDTDLDRANSLLADLGAHAEEVRLSRRPPSGASVARVLVAGDTVDGDVAEPADRFTPAPLIEQISAVTTAATLRQHDVDQVVDRLDRVDAMLVILHRAESARHEAAERVDEGIGRLERSRIDLLDAETAWDEAMVEWWAGAQAVATDELVAPVADHSGDAGTVDRVARRRSAAAAFQAVLRRLQRAEAELAARLDDAVIAVDRAESGVEELAHRSEPDAPRAEWQTAAEVVFADLVDFADHLGEGERAGLEAACEASGLLTASFAEDGTVELAPGELLAIGDQPLTDPAGSLASLLRVVVPDGLTASFPVDAVERVIRSIAVVDTPDANGAGVVAVDGSFRLGPLAGRHHKDVAEYIGVTARRATLDRLRAEAAVELERVRVVRVAVAADLDEATARSTDASVLLGDLPELEPVTVAMKRALDADSASIQDRERLADTEKAVGDADGLHATATNEAARIARSLDLPDERTALVEVASLLRDIVDAGPAAVDAYGAVERSVQDWTGAVGDWRQVVDDHAAADAELTRLRADHSRRATQLATLEDSIGLDYAEVVATIARSTADRLLIDERLPVAKNDEKLTLKRHQQATDHLDEARRALDATVATTVVAVDAVSRFLAAPGVLATVVDERAGTGIGETPDERPDGVSDARSVPRIASDPDGLAVLVDWMSEHIPQPERSGVNAEGMRQSLKQRQASLAGGWDAQDRQPDPDLPVAIVVNGPLGADLHLHHACAAVRTQLATVTSLLTSQQDAALRELLQGAVAQEIAQRLFEAGELVDRMNERMASVTTTHGIGVTLRWARKRDLDEHTARTADLLAKLPELRTVDDDAELRDALAGRLDDARRLHPDVAYRQLIADVLDYRNWFDMAVMVRRVGDMEKRLTRRTPLSEGEKKLVTYQPLFAAVAASCDALATSTSSAPRFLLLDDAFAKVSEDNHAKLFGLLVDLDLDFVATSERLWGTHSTVPELAITEVVRDAEAGAILLEHAHWDGRRLEMGR